MLIQLLYTLLRTVLFTQQDFSNLERSSLSSALFSYKNPRVQKLVRNIKYYRNHNFAHIAGGFIYKEIVLILKHNLVPYIIIPVPMSIKEFKKRGYNQADLLVQAVLKHDTRNFLEYEKDLVIKTKETKSQTTCTRLERLMNLKQAFCVPYPEKIKSKDIIVIDDVTTTGSTFLEITEVLKHAGARRILTLALAH